MDESTPSTSVHKNYKILLIGAVILLVGIAVFAFSRGSLKADIVAPAGGLDCSTCQDNDFTYICQNNSTGAKSCSGAMTVSGSTCVQCNAGPICNGNGFCDLGEGSLLCPGDCPAGGPIVTSCNNNGICDGSETSTNCPNDCPVQQCARQGTICKTAADCGSCGATCEDVGNQNSGTTVIKQCNYLKPDPTRAICDAPPWQNNYRSGPECQCLIPERWDPIGKKCATVCNYSNPPSGCQYVGGGTNPFLCDAKLVCNTPAPSPTTYPYISGAQVTCGSCLTQGKTYACYDIHDPEHIYEQGFCSSTKIAFTPAHIMDTPDCSFCQAGPGVGWCPEDTQECPGGFKISRGGPSCEFPVCPTERKFVVTFNNEPLQVGKKPTSMGVCAVDQDGKIDTSYRGYITVTFETGGPIGDQPFGFFYSIDQFSQGCHTFPGGYIKFVRPGTQKVTVSSQAIRFAYGDTEGTPPTTVSVNVLAAATATPTPNICTAGQVYCADSKCYAGNCCSNNDCPSGQSCSDNTCHPANFTPSPTPTSCSNGAVNFPACNVCPGSFVYQGGACVLSSATSPSPSASPSLSPSIPPSPAPSFCPAFYPQQCDYASWGEDTSRCTIERQFDANGCEICGVMRCTTPSPVVNPTPDACLVQGQSCGPQASNVCCDGLDCLEPENYCKCSTGSDGQLVCPECAAPPLTCQPKRSTAPITIQSAQAIYSIAKGQTVSIGIKASGTSAAHPLNVLKLLLSGIPDYIDASSVKLVPADGVTGQVVVRKDGANYIFLLYGINVANDGQVATISMAAKNTDFSNTGIANIQIAQSTGASVSEIATLGNTGEYVSYRLPEGTFFALRPSNGATPTPTPTNQCFPAGQECTKNSECCSGVCPVNIQGNRTCDAGTASPTPTPIMIGKLDNGFTVSGPQNSVAEKPEIVHACATTKDGSVDMNYQGDLILRVLDADLLQNGLTIHEAAVKTIERNPRALAAYMTIKASDKGCTDFTLPYIAHEAGNYVIEVNDIDHENRYGWQPIKLDVANVTPSPTPTPVLTVCRSSVRGDLNCDKLVNIADLAKLSAYLTGSDVKLTPQQVVNADVTGDKKVNLADIVKLADYLRLVINTLGSSDIAQCLPTGIHLTDVVSASGRGYNSQTGQYDIEKITVEQTLNTLKAECNKDSILIDTTTGMPVNFYRLTGCWGNPPMDYQTILQKQRDEIDALKRTSTVVEMTCNPSGIPIP